MHEDTKKTVHVLLNVAAILGAALIGAGATLGAAYLSKANFGPPPTQDHDKQLVELTARLGNCAAQARELQAQLAACERKQAVPPPPATEPTPLPSQSIPPSVTPTASGIQDLVFQGDMGTAKTNGIWNVRINNAVFAASRQEMERILPRASRHLMRLETGVPPGERVLLLRVALDRATDDETVARNPRVNVLRAEHFQVVDPRTQKRYDTFWQGFVQLWDSPHEVWIGFLVPDVLTEFSVKVERFGAGDPILFNVRAATLNR